MAADPTEAEPAAEREQRQLRVMAAAFRELGRWRVTRVEPTGMSHVEDVSPGQLATIAFEAAEFCDALINQGASMPTETDPTITATAAYIATSFAGKADAEACEDCTEQTLCRYHEGFLAGVQAQADAVRKALDDDL